MQISRKLDTVIGKKWFNKTWYSFIVLFFLFIIITPTVYVLSYSVTHGDDLQKYVFSDTKSITLSWNRSDDANFSKYEIHTSSISDFEPSNSTLIATIKEAKNTNYTLSGLSMDSSSYFKVKIVSKNASAAISNVPQIKSTTISLMPIIINALWFSIAVALVVVVIDFVAGLPLAWLLARKKFPGKRYLDVLVDLPIAVPTAALGFSIAIFWAAIPSEKGILIPFGAASFVSSPFLLVVLLHVAFSYPYMVRSLAAAIEEIDISYEIAAGTLGASPFTVARTITMPLFRGGLATGTILCLARSLSETGATMITLSMLIPLKIENLASTAGITGPALIGTIKQSNFLHLEPALAFISMILIISSILLLIAVKMLITRFKLPTQKVWPRYETLLSRGFVPKLKNASSFIFFFGIVIIPAFFIIGYIFSAKATGVDWATLQYSLLISLIVAAIVTAANLLLGIPLAILIARGKNKKLTATLDTLTDIPIIVPTAALGFSLGLFWRQPIFQPISYELLLIILAHIAFTYPFMVRSVSSAVESTDISYEETGRTLGAGPLQNFRKVLFPMIKPSILAGAIMTFTRSLDETGATIAVIAKDSKIITAPVYIVDLITKQQSYYPAALACIVLIGVSFISLLLLRYVTKKVK